MIAGDEDILARYDAGEAQIIRRRLVSDLETAVSTYLKLTGAAANTFLLESVEGGEQLGRYSIIGMDPDAIWRLRGGKATLALDGGPFEKDERPPLASLKAFVDGSLMDLGEDAPPMAAGVFGFFGYDLVREVEHLPNRPPAAYDLDDAIFIRPKLIAVFDNIRQEINLVASLRPRAGVSARDALDEAYARLDGAEARLSEPLHDARPPRLREGAPTPLAAQSNTPPADYLAMVERARDYIRAGDIFQVVLSQRFETAFSRPPFDLYRALRRTNPSPFLFFLNFDGFSLVGSSPEILVRVRDGDVTIRPIAGTRPRGDTPEKDQALERDLLADPKERAEHLMLLDLGRNDVGRVAATGTVTATEQFVIERYSHVMHIVSNVVGRLKDGIHPVDAVTAGFPAGTVSGAPKIRAMEIIDELERDGRGPYGGAIGYFSASGDVDTCIALRTALVTEGRLIVQAGAGIVADSKPEAEQAECEAKARALFAAAADALNGN